MTLKSLNPIEGKTYLCGDIHGCYDLISYFIQSSLFNKDRDRLIAVGNLINRGSESLQCLKLLREPYFYSVMGSYEDLLLHYLTGGKLAGNFIKNGGDWIKNIKGNDLLDLKSLLEDVKQLPKIFTVHQDNQNNSSSSQYHVIHAEFPLGNTPLTDDIFLHSRTLSTLMSEETQDGIALLWKKTLFKFFDDKFIDDDLIEKFKIFVKNNKHDFSIFNEHLSPIYSGHTLVRRVMTIGGQTNLNTGAVLKRYMSEFGYSKSQFHWSGLTIVEPQTSKFWKIFENETDNSIQMIDQTPLMISLT